MKITFEETHSATRASNYTAVFALKTPALDHSGLSHLVEHLVFRGSKYYPASHELFLINSLLPASINASTQNGFTFFYLTAQSADVFSVLLDYLYRGITQQEYSQAEFELERDGVLTSELNMYESDAEYALHAHIVRGDTSAQAYNHYGGFSDTVTFIRLEDAIAYKGYYYHPSTLSLTIKAPANTPKTWESWPLSSPFRLPKPDGISTPSLTRASESKGKSARVVVSWWMHSCYLNDLRQHKPKLQQHLGESNRVVVEQELNQDGLFALRIVTRDEAFIKHSVIEYFSSVSIKPMPYCLDNQKQPREIADIVNQFWQQEAQYSQLKNKAKPFNDYLSKPITTTLNMISSLQNKLGNWHVRFAHSVLAERFSAALSLQNAPMLPRLFHPLARQMHEGDCFLTQHSNWLLKVAVTDEKKLVQQIIKPKFWQPRLQGECYAMGIARYSDALYVYGAQDKFADKRREFLIAN